MDVIPCSRHPVLPSSPAPVIPSGARDLGGVPEAGRARDLRPRSLAPLGMTSLRHSVTIRPEPLYCPPWQPPPRDYRAEFPIFRRSIYLNSCSLGALSTRSRAKVNEFLDLWETRGEAAWYEIWWSALSDLRSRYARLIGAAEGSIALHPNISVALTAVGEALDYRRRPKVVVTSLDFPTVAYQWLAREPEGIEVVVVESPDGIGVPLDAIVRAVDDRTVLVATSHVFFTSGAIQDVRGLAEAVHRKGALLLVDGYQATGQLPVDVRALDVDFYCSG